MGILSHEQVTLLTDYDADSAYTKAYHTLYANIRFNWDREQVKQQSIQLTTPTAYSGQATAAANVAIAAAQDGTPTILVDADLCAPSLQQCFGSNKHAGLSDLLTSNAITAEAIPPHLSKTFMLDLYLLSAGQAAIQPPQISRLFSTKLRAVLDSLRQFLAEIESRPSIIIFHGPSALTGTDASQIGALVGQTFLTIVSGHTTRTQAKQAQEQLQRAHAKLAGIIMLDN